MRWGDRQKGKQGNWETFRWGVGEMERQNYRRKERDRGDEDMEKCGDGETERMRSRGIETGRRGNWKPERCRNRCRNGEPWKLETRRL